MSQDLDRAMKELRDKRGIDLRGYRRDMVRRRLAARMAHLGEPDVEAYLRRLRDDPDECTGLLDTIAINVSAFFRDPIVFEILAQTVLPEIIERKGASRAREMRLWSAGCAGGEEAYSLAILLHQALKGRLSAWNCLIFATDVDTSAMRIAEGGVYPRQSLAHTKLGVVDRYFTAQGDGFKVRPFIRKMVRFSREDILSAERFAPAESVFGGFDLVLCRNLLIYLSRDAQQGVLRRLHASLAGGGYLVLGQAESLDPAVRMKFREVDARNLVFRKRVSR